MAYTASEVPASSIYCAVYAAQHSIRSVEPNLVIILWHLDCANYQKGLLDARKFRRLTREWPFRYTRKTVRMGEHDTLLSQSLSVWRFVVLLASICAYTLFILRPTVRPLQRKYFKVSNGSKDYSVYGTRQQDVAKGIWRDGNIETNAKSYCEVDRNGTRSNRVLRIRRAVELTDSTWEVSPFSFSTNATSHDNSDNEQIHIILVIVESLGSRDFASKFPRTNAKIRQMQMNHLSELPNLILIGLG